jgi:hypothetical protein
MGWNVTICSILLGLLHSPTLISYQNIFCSTFLFLPFSSSLKHKFHYMILALWSGIAQSVWRLDDGLVGQGIGVSFAAGATDFFSSPQRPDRLWGLPCSLPNVYRRLGVKGQEREAGHYFHLVPRLRRVELYLHISIRLHGLALNLLGTGINLPL